MLKAPQCLLEQSSGNLSFGYITEPPRPRKSLGLQLLAEYRENEKLVR